MNPKTKQENAHAKVSTEDMNMWSSSKKYRMSYT